MNKVFSGVLFSRKAVHTKAIVSTLLNLKDKVPKDTATPNDIYWFDNGVMFINCHISVCSIIFDMAGIFTKYVHNHMEFDRALKHRSDFHSTL